MNENIFVIKDVYLLVYTLCVHTLWISYYRTVLFILVYSIYTVNSLFYIFQSFIRDIHSHSKFPYSFLLSGGITICILYISCTWIHLFPCFSIIMEISCFSSNISEIYFIEIAILCRFNRYRQYFRFKYSQVRTHTIVINIFKLLLPWK